MKSGGADKPGRRYHLVMNADVRKKMVWATALLAGVSAMNLLVWRNGSPSWSVAGLALSAIGAAILILGRKPRA